MEDKAAYTLHYGDLFKKEYQNFPEDQQDAIADFIYLYQQYGLDDLTRYPGMIARSWRNISTDHPNYQHAIRHDLWHYHIGLPEYKATGLYFSTSEWVLHFMWPNKGREITVVDVAAHKFDKRKPFYLPSENYLKVKGRLLRSRYRSPSR